MKFTESHPAVSSPQVQEPSPSGFSFVELLIVVTILGILTTIVVVGFRGVTDQGTDTACAQERRVVATAVESYFANHHVDHLPGMPPADGDEFERGLVSASAIRDVSSYYDVSADGSLVPETGSPCS